MLHALGSGERLFALAIAAVGLIVTVVGAGYPMGATNDPGPGIFPVALGVILILIAIGIALTGGDDTGIGARLKIRPLASVVGAILAWALLVDPIGFIPATIVLVVLSALSEPRFRTLHTTVLALALSLGGYAIFVYGFRMPFDAFGW